MERKRFFEFSALAVILITGVGVTAFALGTNHSISQTPGLTPTSEVATTTVTMTRTFPNGSTVVITSVSVGTGVGCTGETCEGLPRVANEGVAITQAYANATSKTVVIQVKNIGFVNDTLAGANVTVYSVDSAYKGSTVVSLYGIQLGRGLTTDITSPTIPYLVAGDEVSIKVWTAGGPFATDTITAGP